MRLSIALMTTTRPRTVRTVMSQKFVPADVLRGGQVRRRADERVRRRKNSCMHVEQRLVVELAGRLGVAGREDSAVHRNQMRREDDANFAVGDVGEHLVDFGHVAMRADAVGRDAFVALRKMQMRLSARGRRRLRRSCYRR